jgi:hypothetical protein
MSSSKIIYLNKNDFLNNSINGFNSYLNPASVQALVSSQPSLHQNLQLQQQQQQQLTSSSHLGSPMTNGKLSQASSSKNLVYVSPTQEFEKGKTSLY